MGTKDTFYPILLLNHLLELVEIVILAHWLGLDHAVTEMYGIHLHILHHHANVIDGCPSRTLTSQETNDYRVIVLCKGSILLLDGTDTLILTRTTITCIHVRPTTNYENVHLYASLC